MDLSIESAIYPSTVGRYPCFDYYHRITTAVLYSGLTNKKCIFQGLW